MFSEFQAAIFHHQSAPFLPFCDRALAISAATASTHGPSAQVPYRAPFLFFEVEP